jgi:hypothetical protein
MPPELPRLCFALSTMPNTVLLDLFAFLRNPAFEQGPELRKFLLGGGFISALLRRIAEEGDVAVASSVFRFLEDPHCVLGPEDPILPLAVNLAREGPADAKVAVLRFVRTQPGLVQYFIAEGIIEVVAGMLATGVWAEFEDAVGLVGTLRQSATLAGIDIRTKPGFADIVQVIADRAGECHGTYDAVVAQILDGD